MIYLKVDFDTILNFKYVFWCSAHGKYRLLCPLPSYPHTRIAEHIHYR